MAGWPYGVLALLFWLGWAVFRAWAWESSEEAARKRHWENQLAWRRWQSLKRKQERDTWMTRRDALLRDYGL
jgi:hypothetical protein